MKKYYVEPEFKAVEFSKERVITASVLTDAEQTVADTLTNNGASSPAGNYIFSLTQTGE